MTNNPVEKQDDSPVGRMRGIVEGDYGQKLLTGVLGKRGGAFGNSIVNVVRNSGALQKCVPESIMTAAMEAATMNLAIDPSLGQAAIVPYGNQAQFQLMYKGVIQLCIRSGLYESIHCTEIYKDELRSWNPITGYIQFHPVEQYKLREGGKIGDVVGHYAGFKLMAGFSKDDYMSRPEVMAHAEQYSKAYQYDLRSKKGTSAWSTNPVPMGNKTVLLRLLKKFGVMSIEMQQAFVQDASFEAASDRADEIIEAETGSEVADPPNRRRSVKKVKKTKKKVHSTTVNTPTGDDAERKDWICNDQGHTFDTPRVGSDGESTCPECYSTDIQEIE